jgi:hypothetical protein
MTGYAYDVVRYGVERNISMLALFTGKERDSESGYDYFWARSEKSYWKLCESTLKTGRNRPGTKCIRSHKALAIRR